MTSRRAQAALEYTVVIGFALLILTPIFYVMFTSMRGYEEQTSAAQASAIAREIFATAERVHHHGAPSRLTIEVRVPDGLSNLTIRRNNPASGCTKCTEMVYTLKNQAEVVASTFVDVRGGTNVGTEEMPVYQFDQTYVNPGARRFVLEAYADHVELSQPFS
jgi:uncharacterized protein (UPF0333 family)